MLDTGGRIDAQKAFDWGVVNEVVAVGQHLERSLCLAGEIACAAPLAVRAAKQALQHGADTDCRSGYSLSLALHNLLVRTEDRREGILAFNEKRSARWSGR
jgi:enoyl-CoA hydratase/carnithine racemase